MVLTPFHDTWEAVAVADEDDRVNETIDEANRFNSGGGEIEVPDPFAILEFTDSV